MEQPSESIDRALRLRSRVQEGIRALALASDEEMSEEIDALEDALDELEALFDEEEAEPPWPGDPAARLGACRVELERLRRGASTRRDAARRIRLVLPGGVGARSTPPSSDRPTADPPTADPPTSGGGAEDAGEGDDPAEDAGG